MTSATNSGTNTNNAASNSNNGVTMYAMYNFDAEQSPEIALKQYEEIQMLDMDPTLNGWAYGRRKRDGKEGYVPLSFLTTSNAPNNRSHGKHSKSNNPNQSRSSSPNPNKGRFDSDKSSNNGYNARNNNKYGNNMNQSSMNQRNQQNNPNSSNYKQNNNKSSSNWNDDQGDNVSVTSSHTNHSQHNQQTATSSNTNNQPNSSHSSNPQSNVNQNSTTKGNNQSSSSSNHAEDGRQIICSFHRDFIPEMDDLYEYFGVFGKVTNSIEIEYDSKRVPMAKIKFAHSSSVDKVCDKGNRQQIPSGNQNGNIYIRVYRSMHDYVSHMNQERQDRSNRIRHGKYKSSRRGGYQ